MKALVTHRDRYSGQDPLWNGFPFRLQFLAKVVQRGLHHLHADHHITLPRQRMLCHHVCLYTLWTLIVRTCAHGGHSQYALVRVVDTWYGLVHIVGIDSMHLYTIMEGVDCMHLYTIMAGVDCMHLYTIMAVEREREGGRNA